MNFSRKALYKEGRRKITSFSGTCHSMCIGMQWHFRVDSANYWFSIIELDCHSLKVCKNLLSSYYFKSRPKILISLLKVWIFKTFLREINRWQENYLVAISFQKDVIFRFHYLECHWSGEFSSYFFLYTVASWKEFC